MRILSLRTPQGPGSAPLHSLKVASLQRPTDCLSPREWAGVLNMSVEVKCPALNWRLQALHHRASCHQEPERPRRCTTGMISGVLP